MIDWSKTIGGDFDRIDLSAHHGDNWLDIEMRVGNDVERVRMTLRSTEAVRDLHYALGRYLAQIDKPSEPDSYKVTWYDPATFQIEMVAR